MSQTNDFAIRFANVNGTGSASANNLILRSIFRMGIPVSGKNYFPSNIQGLPTWYEIRVSKDGYMGRADTFDVVIAMNAETYAKDVRSVRSGGWLLHDSTWPLSPALKRDDIQYLGVPLAQMCNAKFDKPRDRVLMKNIAYAGVLAALHDIDLTEVDRLLEEQYAKKPALADSNKIALRLGYDYAKKNFQCPLPVRLERMNKTGDQIIIDGNSATALGCLYAGATVAAWYPITPATSVMDSFTAYCKKFRKDPDTGKNLFCIVQAEDELAAMGMVLGASWNGARSFTSTAGPGVSLMQELLGFAYYAEIPAVLIDVQRTGPSTGMPTRTQQSDILICALASHGDTKHIVLFPSNPLECFELSVAAFDLAERFQTPVFVLSDLDIGMNDWMSPEFKWDDNYRPDRGRVMGGDEVRKLGKKFQRYSDEDSEGVTSRTLPGVDPKAAFFTRGSGHNKFGVYTEIPEEYQEVMERLTRKHKGAAGRVPKPVIRYASGNGKSKPARVGLVSLGGGDAAMNEAVDRLAAMGLACDYMRVRAYPFSPEVEAYLAEHEVNYVVEQNRDGQLRSLMLLDTEIPKSKLKTVPIYSGFPLAAFEVVDAICKLEGRDVPGPGARANANESKRLQA